mmetsp:Transcript_35900/g.49823  ORF Transcript_35900/g.49823 Transcript_35900/m.49823 type:complete len:146 (-) Transcript_35900:177-614(-)|eukprot:CAMPEP_0196570854 /NCGR_PEP_ID=MMETSP1081-20130531/1034_1 /TAXON_ID=36882 /ORGANISM="Pyramimonas amylifera, Strain CCMP720" /LENGTH=145 /DNA_ID=CAMNT_0041887535 /DNA_START=108 /DNA_END=545 /DNA_ORIENTATION=-
MAAIQHCCTLVLSSARSSTYFNVQPPLCLKVPALRGKKSLRASTVAAAVKAAPLKTEDMSVFGDRVLLRKEENSDTTAGGLMLGLGDSADPDFTVGEVVSVGVDVTLEISPSSKILVAGYGGTPVKIEDEMLYFVKEQDIMAVCE